MPARERYPPGKTDVDYVKALLHATACCAYMVQASVFRLSRAFLRIVFLASLEELTRDLRLDGELYGRVLALIRRSDIRSRLHGPHASDRDDGRRRRDPHCPALGRARSTPCRIYVSALIAMGFAPLVTFIERRKPAPRSAEESRAGAAILSIYLVVIGGPRVPRLDGHSSARGSGRALWEHSPISINRVAGRARSIQAACRGRSRLAEAVSSAPSGSGTNASAPALVALSSVIGGRVRRDHDS